MRAIDTRSRKKWIIKFIGVLIITAGLLWLVKLVIWRNNPAVFSVNNPATADTTDHIIASQQRELLSLDEVLHEHLNTLQNLDVSYSALMTDTVNKNGLIEMNDRISAEEESFRRSIDSVAKEVLTYPNRVDENLFVNMIASFRLALENRRSIANLRNAIANGKTTLSPDQKSMLKLKNDLLSKETRIAYLESALKSKQNSNDNPSTAQAEIASNEKDNKIAHLTAINNTLQKESDRLSKQLSEAGKNFETNESSSKSRNASLENKIDELNAELRLAQVDCNLARVDASQIISNSKQRRHLLSEALSILNSLSKSDNVYTQKKIQDKMARLNQVATNYRD
ncbi:MAG: hypothetical protein H7Z13_00100 [Ferruginibacter sp.]|nr:hypothetical protein [Ferruginibacter sp.]